MQNDALYAEAEGLRGELGRLEEQLRPGSLTERTPTQWAYEQACKAVEKHRGDAARLREKVSKLEERLREAGASWDFHA